MLVIMGALREEIKDLQRHMVLDKAFTWQDCHFYRGRYKDRDVILLQTGMGKEQAEAATKFVLAHYSVTALILLGFAGALTEQLKIGDIVLCLKLYCSGEHEDIEPQSNGNYFNSSASLISLAIQNAVSTATRFYQGSSVTVAKPVLTQETKRTLGKAFGADVVEMENYWIAQIALARQVPFIAIRAISDNVQDSLPFGFIDSHGVLRWELAIPYFILHPRNLIDLFILYRNVRRARKSLTIFVDRFVANL